jgi:enhancing lycopene biosynthesis protein 2
VLVFLSGWGVLDGSSVHRVHSRCVLVSDSA